MKTTYVIIDGSKVYHIKGAKSKMYYAYDTLCGFMVIRNDKLTLTRPRDRRLCKACAKARGK